MNNEQISNILMNVQNDLNYDFGVEEIVEIMGYTVRKCHVNGEGESYIPILFENELYDYVARKKINERGRIVRCANIA